MHFKSLFAKLTLPVAGIVILMFTVYGLIDWKLRSNHSEERSARQAATLVGILEDSVYKSMMDADMEAAEQLFVKLGESPEIRWVFIQDRKGAVKVSSRKDASGLVPPTQDELNERGRNGWTANEEASDGTPFFLALTPLNAASECLTCHDDVSVGEPLGYLGVHRWVASEKAELAEATRNAIFTTIVMVVLLVGVLVWRARAITRPLSSMATVAQGLAKGDLEQRISYSSSDELGQLAESFRRLVEYIRGVAAGVNALAAGNLAVRISQSSERDELARCFNHAAETLAQLIQETNRIIETTQVGKLDQRARADRFEGGYRQLLEGFNTALDAIVHPLQDSQQVLKRFAERDLTAYMERNYQGDFSVMKEALNRVADQLNLDLVAVEEAAEQVRMASGEIRSGSQALATGASQQAASLQTVSHSLEQVAAMADANSHSARQTASQAESAYRAMEMGMESIRRLSTAIEAITASANQSAKVVRTIDEIAFQTNLLALNAAVEAARAGDAGRGFAVVADEVRSLALRSAEAARETSDLIDGSIVSSREGVARNQEAMDRLQEMRKMVEAVRNEVSTIAAASEKQREDLTVVTQSLGDVNRVTQQSAASAEESAGVAEELQARAEEVSSLVGEFKLRRDSKVRVQASKPNGAWRPPAPKALPAGESLVF